MEGKTILVVDDDMAFSDMLSEILTEEGARVIVEHDGQSGLEQALANKPDLVMFDVMMPRMTGVEALAHIRATEWGKTVPAFLLTNMNQPEALAKASADGAPVECLLKTDWTLDQVAEKIKGLLAPQG